MSARLSSEEMQAVQRLMEPEIKHWEKKPQCKCRFFRVCRGRAFGTLEEVKAFLEGKEVDRLLQRKAEEAKKALAALRWRDISESDKSSIDTAINSGDISTINTLIGKGVLSTTQLVLRILQMWVDSDYTEAKLEFLRKCWPSLPKDDQSTFDREEMNDQVIRTIQCVEGEGEFTNWDRVYEFMKCYA